MSSGRRCRAGAALAAAALLSLAAGPAAAGPGAFEAQPQPLSLAAWTPLELAARVDSRAGQVEAEAQVGAETGAKKPAGGRKALLLSLLLPGLGEMSLGERGRATGFFVAEGAIWTHFVWFQVAGRLRKDNYIEQAQRHAGVGVGDADDTYWKLVGQYQTSQGTGADAYEETLRREARDLHPTDPVAQDAWVAERLPSGDEAWSWGSAEARASYRETRESSRRAYDRSKYSIAAAIVNRIVSAIDTQIVRRKLSRAEQSARPEAGPSTAATAPTAPGTPLLLLADTAPDGSARLYLTRSF